MNAPTMLDAALEYAAQGWPVFPLMPKGKTPLTAHGFKDATTDEAQIRAWWTETPDANMGPPPPHRRPPPAPTLGRPA